MDSDCLICFGSHLTSECKDRKPQHCSDCHAFVNHSSDHSQICGKKDWLYRKYEDLYVKPLKERCMVTINSPFRILKDGCWRKTHDALEMYSAESGAFFQFISNNDISLLTTRFEPIRIAVVVKDKVGDSDIFDEKLLLSTCKKQIIIPTGMNKPFNRNESKKTHEWKTHLILAVSAADEPCIAITVFPVKSPPRELKLRYNKTKQIFIIPNDLMVDSSTDMYQYDGIVYAQLNDEVDLVADANAESESVADTECELVPNTQIDEPKVHLQKCFECHAEIHTMKDHAKSCSATWFISQPTNVYVKNPTIRCVLRFGSSFTFQLNKQLVKPHSGMRLFSSMADAFFKFDSDLQVSLLTTEFTRLRIPIVVENTERIVLVTSQDRTMVAAKSSRLVNETNVLSDFEHNTPLVFNISGGKDTSVIIEIHSSGFKVNTYEIEYRQREKKFIVPDELDIKSNKFELNLFDAVMPAKLLK